MTRATDAPTEKILDRKPSPKSASLFTMTMWKMILGQAIYQLAITFMLYFAGDKLLSTHLSSTHPELRADQLSTVVFNTFVWMQIFNEFNNRRLDNRFNIFEGMFRNYWFLGINLIMVGGQVMIVYVGGAAFGVTRLGGILWAVCLVCAIGCLPWAVVLRMIPDRHFGVVFDAVVGGMAFFLKPVVKASKIIGHGTKAFFQPVMRFIRRVLSRKDSQSDDTLDTVGSSRPSVRDKEASGSNELQKIDRAEDYGRPQTPQSISVPPIMITSSP